MSDRIFGGFCLALAGLFIWQATRIETGFIVDPLGPSAFPIIVGCVLALAGLYPLLFPDRAASWPSLRGWLEIVFAVGVMAAYALALPDAGFVAATAVATALLSWRLGSRPHAAAAAGVVVALGIYGVFHLVLGLSLAEGPWGF